MNRETLENIARQCEEATEPDYEIDAAIADAICKGSWYAPDNPAWKFTASVDAALTLVPEDAWWSVQSFPCGEGFLASVGNDDERQAATPALAITAAALRAQAAKEVA